MQRSPSEERMTANIFIDTEKAKEYESAEITHVRDS